MNGALSVTGVQLYKAGLLCNTSAATLSSPCCTTADKLVWNNVWSLRYGGASAPSRPGIVSCPPGQVVDVVQTVTDNGSCDCKSFCAANWGNEVKAQRSAWTGSTSFDADTATLCRCIQATHWCNGSAALCSDACDGAGVPTPVNYCKKVYPRTYFVTSQPVLVTAMTAPHAAPQWTQTCASTIGSSVFCVSGGSDGRDGPFMVYNTPSAAPGARALYRCSNTSLGAQQAQTHAHAAAMPASFLSTDARCEGLGSQPDELIGYIAAQRGGETLRALRRCFPPGDQASLPGARTHALDLECLGHPDGDVLGYVR
eukprot:m.1195217 g.1195217  ORF g.1195217 m.1195217 type:complete len:313 (+) comp24562_c1_seq64:224-1162(+)